VILADDLLDSTVPVLKQMIDLHKLYGCSLIGVEEIAPEQSRSYGVVSGTPFDRRLHKLDGIVEKPAPECAPSNMGVVGRYILTPAIFKHLRNIPFGSGGELQLTDGIAALLTQESVLAYAFEGIRYDCGSKQGYLQATVQYALKHPEVRDAFQDFLNELPMSAASAARELAWKMRQTLQPPPARKLATMKRI
jgi:UTP--glucose-1-phosphate uridylyltransferase